MTANHAWMLKGWLLAEHAPAPIMEAVESVIESLSHERADGTVISSNHPALTIRPEPLPDDLADVARANDSEEKAPERSHQAVPVETTEPLPAEGKKPRKKNSMSPENRAAAGERMRAIQAAKKAAREHGNPATAEVAPSAPPQNPYQPVSIEKLRTDHDEFVGKRDPGQPLTDSDWPEIKAMLAKSPDRKKIASDYDVDIDDLNFFITSCQRREQRSGEALAPLHRGA
jgi:hypothetical protein